MRRPVRTALLLGLAVALVGVPVASTPDQSEGAAPAAFSVPAPPTYAPLTAEQRTRVVEGSDGNLFIAQDWTVPCQDAGQAGRVAAAVRDLGAAFTAGGREAVVTVAPDKSTVRAREAPRVAPVRACGDAARAALWGALASAGPVFLDLRPDLLEADERLPTYWRTDTHWTPTGGAVYARALAGHLDPTLADRLTTRPQTQRRDGDLARAVGRPDDERVRGQRLVNPGVRVEELPRPDIGMGQPARRTRATRVQPGARVLPGRTVLVGDSFDDVAVEQLAPLFEEALFFWPGGNDSSLPTISAQLVGADRVVLETVERFAQRFRMFDPEAVEAVRRLPPRP